MDLYLDGELAAEERAEVEAHFRDCEECRLVAAGEARFRASLRQALVTVRAPRSLHEQVARRIRDARHGSQPRTYVLAYAAAVVMVAGIGYAGVSMFSAGAQDPAGDAVAAHAARAGTEVYGDAQRVSRFLTDHAPFAFRGPIEDREGVRLVGARVTQLGNVPAIVYLYDLDDGKRLSVAQYPGAGAPVPALDHREGYVVASWSDGGLVQTVVGDIPDREVTRVVPASWGN